MKETLDGITSSFGARYDLVFEEKTLVTYNDPKFVDESIHVMRKILGDSNVVQIKPQMVAEDFSYYQKVIPGFYYFLGVGNKSKGITAQTHSPDFDLDEDSLVIGVKLMSGMLLEYLDRHISK